MPRTSIENLAKHPAKKVRNDGSQDRLIFEPHIQTSEAMLSNVKSQSITESHPAIQQNKGNYAIKSRNIISQTQAPAPMKIIDRTFVPLEMLDDRAGLNLTQGRNPKPDR